jgi:hypothetical protein
MPTQVKEILLDNEYLSNQNANYRSYCQDLADFFLPRKSWINSIRIKGERVKFNFLYDSTAILAARTAAHGIHSNLTNESMRWFQLESTEQSDMKRRDVRLWFKEVEDKKFAALRGSNYYNVQQEDYHNKLVFGTGTYSMLEDEKDKVKFKNIDVGNVNRVVDDNGRLIEIYVNFRLSARQAFKIFGNKCGESVMKALAKTPFEEFEFVHYVGERHDRDVRYQDAANMEYKSCWIQKKDKHLINESGFMEMPYISDVFYSDSNDPNGFSPAMDVFPWVKLVNAMSRTVIRAGMKQSDPPLVAPSRGFVLPLNFNPAAMNYRDPKTAHDAIQALPTVNGRIEIGVDLIRMVVERIEQGMFVPLFQTLNNITKQLSILEAQQLISQNMSILGPVIGRFDYGTLSPMIFRLYNILNRNLDLPPPPESLEGKGFRVVYLGPLAKAQKQAEIGETQAWMADVHNIGAIIPSAYDNVDEDKLINYLHRTRGVTPEILREEEAIAQMRKHREEQQQLIAALQAGQAGADIAKTGAEAGAVGTK